MMKLIVLVLVIFLPRVAVQYTFNGRQQRSSIDDFVRVSSSTDPNETVVAYFNGTVYGRFQDAPLQALFWLEGYNINRKIPKTDGGFWGLSREFVVYRDFHTRQILDVFTNPFTTKPNEVFPVANNPVNQNLSGNAVFPSIAISDDLVAFEGNYVLEYPNPLEPTSYPRFSAGKIYDATELFTYYANISDIVGTTKPNVPSVITWSRRCQFLPWMEMGQMKGSLFYSTFAWKCTNGLSCVAKDILEMVSTKYKDFLSPPKTYDVPNETSWTVFKKTIDTRRRLHLPDIIIPQVNVSFPNISSLKPYIDKRIQQNLLRSNFSLDFNATLRTQIYGQQSIILLHLKGQTRIATYRSATSADIYMQVYSIGTFLDSKTEQPIKEWYNPLTNQTVDVPMLNITEMWDLTKLNSYSTNIDEVGSIGLSIISNQHKNEKKINDEEWYVSIANFIFRESELQKKCSKIYGTYHRYSSWFPWMGMNDRSGSVILKAIFATQ